MKGVKVETKSTRRIAMLIFGILSICLSLDVFVCALEQGASIRNIRFSKALVYGLIFALCSSGMFLLGHGMSTYILGRPWATLNKYVAIFVFLILGIGMVIYSFKRGKFVERLQEFDTKQIIKLALIGGLDCFFVGVGCYYMNLSYLMESLVLFLIVLAGYMIHFYIGYYNGAGYQKAYYFLCGVVYLFMSLSLIFKLIRL